MIYLEISSDLGKEFGKRFEDSAEIEKLLQSLNNSHKVFFI